MWERVPTQEGEGRGSENLKADSTLNSEPHTGPDPTTLDHALS